LIGDCAGHLRRLGECPETAKQLQGGYLEATSRHGKPLYAE